MLTTSKVSVKTLVGMVTEMLDVSRLESGTMQLNVTPFDLGELAAQIVRDMKPLAGSRALSLQVSGSLPIEADRELIGRVVKSCRKRDQVYACWRNNLGRGYDTGRSNTGRSS